MANQMSPSPSDLLLAIRRKCLDCMCNHAKLVKGCSSKDCPLYPYRSADVLPVVPSIRRDQLPGQLSMLP